MRKRIVSGDSSPTPGAAGGEWLDLESLCSVEVTSEDAAHPVENAFRASGTWRAGHSGKQTMRLLFDAPQHVRRIDLEIEETAVERTQELAIHWSDDRGQRHELRRQRWNFSPSGSTLEHEDYRVDLAGLTALEVVLDPDVSSGSAIASLRRLRLA